MLILYMYVVMSVCSTCGGQKMLADPLDLNYR